MNKEKRTDIFVLIIALVCFMIFLKMCQVTVNNKDQREPLREIYDSH
jgi:hypothetical protein